MKVESQIEQNAYRPGEGFIGNYQRIVKEVVIPYQYEILNDRIADAEKSHVVANFVNAGRVLQGLDEGDGFYGMVFQDSDAAKWLEAVAYSLSIFPDEELKKKADHLIDIIAAAQDTDGYLNTYFTIKDRDRRWKNLQEGHELYCAGHMMEAACAYCETTGEDKLLKVMTRNAEHIYQHFVVEHNEGYPGHPEVELALMKMYRMTGETHCLELAKHFIDQRGVDPKFFEKEAAERDWVVWGSDAKDHDYMQCDLPVRQQKDAVGHAVRAVYLYTAMADLAAETEDAELVEACRRLWNSITQRRMYLTGGIGSTGIGEAFSVDYDLPGDTAYAETCASIGLMFFASRMLELEVNGNYGDVMERAFYNTVLAGMQLDGKRFFYVNPLEVLPGISGVAVTHRHDLPVRPKWYACACCPPNVARLISSFGKYAYGENDKTVYCHLYAEGEVTFANGLKLNCRTKYPYEFQIEYEILDGQCELAVRIPAWSRSHKMLLNGQKVKAQIQKGYQYIQVKTGDRLMLNLDGEPYFVYASEKVPRLTGMTAVCRGPLVYCFEGVDNQRDVLGLSLNDQETIQVEPWDEKLLHGTVRMLVPGTRTRQSGNLYSMEPPAVEYCMASAIPYYTWGNRGENQMRVWMNLSRS